MDSPSNSLEAVSGGVGRPGEAVSTPHNGGSAGTGNTPLWDSDTEAEAEAPDWKNSVPEEIVKQLTPHEIKRQEVINE